MVSINNLAVALAASSFYLSGRGEEETLWPYRSFKRFTITEKTLDVWAAEEDGGINEELFQFFCRFTRAEVRELARELDIPTKFAYDEKTGWPLASTESPEEALLVFLWRSAHPLALGHLITVFGKSRPWLSRVFNGVLNHLWMTWGSRIEFDTKLMAKPRIEQYTAAIGGSLSADGELIFGFIDGTEIAICRPMFEDQQLFYSGHKKQHAVSHLAIVLPNGLFGAVFLGLPAAGGDASLCIQVGLGQRLQELLSWLPSGEYRYVYGDAAFGAQDFVLGPYKRANGQYLTPTQKKLNQWLSTRRIMVEHGFGGVKTAFKLLTLRTSLVTGLAPIGIYFPVFSFLYNCRTCMRGYNQISKMFDLAPPSLRSYLAGEFEVEEVENVRE